MNFTANTFSPSAVSESYRFAGPDEPPLVVRAGAVLLPHEEERAPRPPLPAQHHVRAERQDVEVRVRELDLRLAIGECEVSGLLVADQARPFGLAVDPKIVGARGLQLADVGIAPGSGERFGVELEARVRA